VKCKVQEVPQRSSLIFYEEADIDGNKQYAEGESLLILAMHKKNGHSVIIPVWGQIDITKNEENKTCSVKKIPKPRYEGTYTLNYGENTTSVTISGHDKASFYAKLKSNASDIACGCSLQTTHLAICYPNNGKGALYIEFNKDGVKLIKNYDDNIYNTKLITSDDGGALVLHTTLKK